MYLVHGENSFLSNNYLCEINIYLSAISCKLTLPFAQTFYGVTTAFGQLKPSTSLVFLQLRLQWANYFSTICPENTLWCYFPSKSAINCIKSVVFWITKVVSLKELLLLNYRSFEGLYFLGIMHFFSGAPYLSFYELFSRCNKSHGYPNKLIHLQT